MYNECTKEHNVEKCNQCVEFPCGKISSMLERSKEYQKRCKEVCPNEEYNMLMKALYLATFEATKKWTQTIRNWGSVYGELCIMYEGRLPE